MPSHKNPSTFLIRDYESIHLLPLQGANGWGMYCIVKYKNAAPSLHLVNNQSSDDGGCHLVKPHTTHSVHVTNAGQ